MNVASTSRVMSSSVGPSPPVTKTTSARSQARRSTDSILSALSPTTWWYRTSTPISASRSPIHFALVLAIWPEQEFGADPDEFGSNGGAHGVTSGAPAKMSTGEPLADGSTLGVTLGSSTPNEKVLVHSLPGSPGAPRSRPSTVSWTEPPSATVITSSSAAENDSDFFLCHLVRLLDPVDHHRDRCRPKREQDGIDRRRRAHGRRRGGGDRGGGRRTVIAGDQAEQQEQAQSERATTIRRRWLSRMRVAAIACSTRPILPGGGGGPGSSTCRAYICEHLVGAQAHVLGVRAQRTSDEGVAGQRLEVFTFERGELVDAELGVTRGFVQGQTPDQPRPRKRRADPDRVLQGWSGHGVGRDDSPSPRTEPANAARR